MKDEGSALRQRTGSDRVWWKDSGLLEGADLMLSYGDESKPKLMDYTAKGEGKVYDVPASFLRKFAVKKRPPTIVEESSEDGESDTPNLKEAEKSSAKFTGKGLLNLDTNFPGGRDTSDLELIYPTTDKLLKIPQYALAEGNYLDLDFKSPRPGFVFSKPVKSSLPDLSPAKSETDKSDSESPKKIPKRPGDLTTDAFAVIQKSIMGGQSEFLESLHDSWYVAANKLDGLEATEGWGHLSNYELRKNRQLHIVETSILNQKFGGSDLETPGNVIESFHGDDGNAFWRNKIEHDNETFLQEYVGTNLEKDTKKGLSFFNQDMKFYLEPTGKEAPEVETLSRQKTLKSRKKKIGKGKPGTRVTSEEDVPDFHADDPAGKKKRKNIRKIKKLAKKRRDREVDNGFETESLSENESKSTRKPVVAKSIAFEIEPNSRPRPVHGVDSPGRELSPSEDIGELEVIQEADESMEAESVKSGGRAPFPSPQVSRRLIKEPTTTKPVKLIKNSIVESRACGFDS